MASYIAFIATLNLCLGYALGVWIGVMPGISPRLGDEGEDDEFIDLVRSATPAPPSEATQPAQASASAAAPPPADSAAEDPIAEQTEVDSTSAETTSPEPIDVLEGLAAFKARLESVSARLGETADDRRAIDVCAGELKQANSEFLEHSTVAIDRLGLDSPVDNSIEQQQLRQTLVGQSAEVERANQEIDEILAESDNDVVRQRLIHSSEQLVESTTAVEQVIQELAPSLSQPDEVPKESPGDTVSNPFSAVDIERLQAEIEDHMAVESAGAPLQVAAVSLAAGGESTVAQAERLIRGLQRIVERELNEGQSVGVDEAGRLLLVLTGDDEPTANLRCERIRQQVAATTFRQDGVLVTAAARCAVADTARAETAQRWWAASKLRWTRQPSWERAARSTTMGNWPPPSRRCR